MSTTTLTAAAAAGTPDLTQILDARGQKRSPASIPGWKPPRPPATKGLKFPPDAPPVQDVVRFLQACTPQRPGRIGELSALRLRTLTVVLWRTGLRISEGLALEERDLDRRNRTITVRSGKGGKRRLVMMDEWGWCQLEPWLAAREQFPLGPLFCVLEGPTAGRRAMMASQVRRQFRDACSRAGLRRRITPHSLRHGMTADGWREGIGLFTLQRQLGHARSSTTEIYLKSIADTEVLQPFGDRPAPTMPLPPI